MILIPGGRHIARETEVWKKVIADADIHLA